MTWPTMLNIVLALIGMSLVAASIFVWAVVVRRWLKGSPPVPQEPYRAVPWGLLDVVLAIVLLFVLSILTMALVGWQFGVGSDDVPANLPLPYQRWKVTGLSLASLATLLVSAGIISRRCRLSPGRLGLSPERFWYDVRLGVAAFLALAPPTYALQFVLVELVVESKHPLVELLRDHPDPMLIAASIGSAVIVAPLFEEYLFRGLLQGWLEKLVSHTGDPTSLFLGGEPGLHDSRVQDAEDRKGDDRRPRFGGVNDHDRDNPYASPAELPAEDHLPSKPVSLGDSPVGFGNYLPILASSTLFAALHMSHGPDCVPLFFLALGLGYLYRQTHRLLPCIVVHFLLNSCSMGMFLFELLR